MFETEKEMLEGAEILRNFDLGVTKKIADEIGSKRIIFSGMGSSFLFPAKQAKERSVNLNIKNCVEAFCSSDLLNYNKLLDSYIFLCSNSGETKETVLLFKHAKKLGAKCVAVTSQPRSILAKKCDKAIIMKCGYEKKVAATKSVIEQALILDSLIFNLAYNQGVNINFKKLKKSLLDTSKTFENNLCINVPKKIVNELSVSPVWYFVGKDNGVGEEICLKSHELVRKTAFFYPGTQILHGYEESMSSNPVVLFEPSKFKYFLEDFKKFALRNNCELFAVAKDRYKGIESIKTKSNKLFENYCLLAAGLGLLRNVINKLRINIDKPKKILKVQNPYLGK